MVEEESGDVFRPVRLDVPVTVGMHSRAVIQMMRVRSATTSAWANFFAPPGTEVDERVRITFTAALSRATRYLSDDVSIVEAVDAVWGVEWKSDLDVRAFRPALRRPERRVKIGSRTSGAPQGSGAAAPRPTAGVGAGLADLQLTMSQEPPSFGDEVRDQLETAARLAKRKAKAAKRRLSR